MRSGAVCVPAAVGRGPSEGPREELGAKTGDGRGGGGSERKARTVRGMKVGGRDRWRVRRKEVMLKESGDREGKEGMREKTGNREGRKS